jgi:hypothetical protein
MKHRRQTPRAAADMRPVRRERSRLDGLAEQSLALLRLRP